MVQQISCFCRAQSVACNCVLHNHCIHMMLTRIVFVDCACMIHNVFKCRVQQQNCASLVLFTMMLYGYTRNMSPYTARVGGRPGKVQISVLFFYVFCMLITFFVILYV